MAAKAAAGAAAEIHGATEPGFETVREVFYANRAALGTGGGAFAACVDGNLVVDLYAGEARHGVPWSAETLGVLFSATKGLTTLCAQILADRGLLDIEQPVAFYWPEFARNGKQHVTVRQVLDHSSGVIEIPGYADLFQWDGSGFDRYQEVCNRLENATVAWPPGTRHGYHAATFGYLLGKLIRIVSGKSLGTFFAESVAGPLQVEVRIGTPKHVHWRVPEFSDTSLGRPTDPDRARVWDAWHDPTTLSGKSFLAKSDGNGLDHIASMMNRTNTLEAELGTSNATGTARDLARVYAALACGGELGPARLLSRERIVEWSRESFNGIDAASLIPWRWALGYHLQSAALTLGGRQPGPFGPNIDGAFGHVGHGGQAGAADPERRVSIAFLRNQLSASFRLPALLTHALYQCLL
jgi:CubicO group peptidase (beta-lactamase class C family)